MKLLLSGRSVSELREEAIKFLAETESDRTTILPAAQSLSSNALQEKSLGDLGDELTANAREINRQRLGLPPETLPAVSAPVAAPTYSEDEDLADTPPAIPPSGPAGNIGEFGFDKRGFPWDQRIHAVTKGTNKDGSWRYRRGVDDATINAVEQELLAKIKAQPMQTAPVALPEVPVAPTPAPVPLAVVPPLQPVAPVAAPVVAPAMPAVPVQAPVTFTHSLETFKTALIPTLGKLVEMGKLTQGYIESLKTYFQVDQIWKINDAQVAEMFETFAANGLIQKVG